eukprot:349015-Prorocentrum_minimum.AAC.1
MVLASLSLGAEAMWWNESTKPLEACGEGRTAGPVSPVAARVQKPRDFVRPTVHSYVSEKVPRKVTGQGDAIAKAANEDAAARCSVSSNQSQSIASYNTSCQENGINEVLTAPMVSSYLASYHKMSDTDSTPTRCCSALTTGKPETFSDINDCTASLQKARTTSGAQATGARKVVDNRVVTR